MELSYSTVPSKVAHVHAAGSRMVRQVFTPPTTITAVSAAICMQKLAGTNVAMTVGLRSSGSGRGTLLGSFTIPASQFADGSMSGSSFESSAAQWESGDFPTPLLLTGGTTYRLEFSTTGDGQYMGWPLRRGLSYGYTDNPVMWPAGQAQYSTDNGSTWTDFYGSDDDLPAYLEY
jgi:hypothetical protein